MAPAAHCTREYRHTHIGISPMPPPDFLTILPSRLLPPPLPLPLAVAHDDGPAADDPPDFLPKPPLAFRLDGTPPPFFCHFLPENLLFPPLLYDDFGRELFADCCCCCCCCCWLFSPCSLS